MKSINRLLPNCRYRWKKLFATKDIWMGGGKKMCDSMAIFSGKISKKNLTIPIKSKIGELEKDEINLLFSWILAFRLLEVKQYGNEYKHAFIEISYEGSEIEKEYINIFKVVRSYNYHDFSEYGTVQTPRFRSQNIETKLTLNDYEMDDIVSKQLITIEMMFNIQTHTAELEHKHNKILKKITTNFDEK